MKKICLISNSAPVYRKGIYDLMDREYNIMWAFGRMASIKDLDTSYFKGSVTYLKRIDLIFGLYLLKGSVKICIRHTPDYYIIIGDIKCLSAWICALIAKLKSKKVLFWSHGSLRDIKGIRKILLNSFWSIADCGLIYNNRSRELMLHNVKSCKNYLTIYNSLDYERQLSIRIQLSESDIYRLHFNNSNPVIAFIGRLIPSKKLNIIIKLASKLNSTDSPFRVNIVLIGDGEEKHRLKNMTDSLGLSSCVWFYGACYDEKVNAELLYNADLCISPGEVGLTAIHSMMYGLPVATHNNLNFQGPEFEAIINNRTGFFFDENDIYDLYNQTILWFTKNSSKRAQIRRWCYDMIDSIWNPKYQLSILNNALDKI